MALIVDLVQGNGGRHVPRQGPSEFADAGYCGHSFNQGVIRFHDSQTGPMFRESVFAAFPEIKRMDRQAVVLAFDWQGCQYLTAKLRGERELMVLKADIGVGTLEPLAPVVTLAAILKAPDMQRYFYGERFDEWRALVDRPGSQLSFTDCVDFQVPLFLGGEDTAQNMQLTDMDVAWTIGGQLLAGTRSL